MNLISLPSKFLSRQCSTKKADRIKILNSNKNSLFGPVKKSEGKKRLKSNDNAGRSHDDNIFEPSKLSKIRNHENSYSSEMFWVLGRKWNQILDNTQPPKTLQLIETPKPKSKLLNVNRQDPLKPNSNPTSEPDIAPNENIPTVVTKKILLSEDELKNLKRHPLITTVEGSTEIHQSLSTRNIPSVGKILQCTMPEAARNALIKWKLSKIFELGEQGFADLQRSNLNSGYAFHHSLEHYFSTNETPLATSPVHKLWESVSGVLDTFNASPVLVEKHLLHPTLKYKGICDCVSDVENQLTLIEWKKSGRSKPTLDSTYDAPLQLCAYLGALHSIPEYRGRIKQGMVVVAYEDGKQADVYKLDEIMLRKYWRSWLARLHEFWIRTRDDTLLEPI